MTTFYEGQKNWSGKIIVLQFENVYLTFYFRHLRSVLLQNNRLIRTPWMLSRPEYFPSLKNIATGGNPLISEEESPPRKQKQHDRNNPTSKSNKKTTANHFESDSGVASSHEEEWASNNSGKKYANLNALFKHLIKA